MAPVVAGPYSDYRCNLRNMQCKARLANGNRCSRNTLKTIPYCWQHVISHYGLQVKPSVRVPGQLGIFATQDFPINVIIIDHPYGELISERNVTRRYGNFDSPFIIPTAIGNKVWDDTCSRGLMGYVQDHVSNTRGFNPRDYNTRYGTIGGSSPNKIVLVTTKAIFTGDELLVNKGFDPANVRYPRTLARANSNLENRFLWADGSGSDDRYGDTTYNSRVGRTIT